MNSLAGGTMLDPRMRPTCWDYQADGISVSVGTLKRN
jgi:hypothetical protein